MMCHVVTPKDWQYLLKIERLIEKEISKPDLPEGCGEKPEMSKSAMKGRHMPGRHGGKGRHSKRGNGGKRHGKPKNKPSNNAQQ